MTSQRIRYSGDDAVKRYLDGIGSYPLLSAEEETALAQAIERGRQAQAALPTVDTVDRDQLQQLIDGGDVARRRFIQANLRLVVSIAKRYQHSGIPFLDLVQEGNLGLIRAVEKFEYRKGFKFSTYATWWIRQAISRSIADKGRTIRVPVHMIDTIGQVQSAETELIKKLGRQPSDAEIAAEAGLTPDRVADARRVAPEPVSIFEPVGEDNAVLGDFIVDTDAVDPFEVALLGTRLDELVGVLDLLTDRERQVITMRYGLGGTEPCTLDEVGRHFEITRERVRQIEAKALLKMRQPVRMRKLRDAAV